MMDCLIIGDSIAVGVSQFRTDCVSISKGGITSSTWIRNNINRPAFDMVDYRSAVISLGANDNAYVDTEAALAELRATLRAEVVFWIMPNNNQHAQKVILKLAARNGDKIVYMKDIAKDGIHPTTTGYKWLAYETKTGMQ